MAAAEEQDWAARPLRLDISSRGEPRGFAPEPPALAGVIWMTSLRSPAAAEDVDEQLLELLSLLLSLLSVECILIWYESSTNIERRTGNLDQGIWVAASSEAGTR